MSLRPRRGAFGVCASFFLVLVLALSPSTSGAAPFASLVMDARTGEVLQSTNADSRLHPASLTKMMTLYIAFEAIRLGEISLDTMVTISAKAAAEPPSKLGLRAGQQVQLRYLIRAAAVKSANDAATAIGEAIAGSEAAFARRMNRTARALGMTRSTFRNAHGLTEEGHLSTARDMSILGRHLFYDYPQYYNIFSRRSTDAGLAEVANTNRRFLDAYEGADGIKTGYTRAAGFNLVASAERRRERIIATVFGGTSTADRNAKMADLLDLGFSRAPSRASVIRPNLPRYDDVPEEAVPETLVLASNEIEGDPSNRAAGKIVRMVGAPVASVWPRPRSDVTSEEPPPELLAAIESDVAAALASVAENDALTEAAAAAAAEVVAEVAASEAASEAASAVELAEVDAVEEPTAPVAETAVATLAPQPRPDTIGTTPNAGVTATETPVTLAEAGPASAAPGAEEEEAVSLASTTSPAPEVGPAVIAALSDSPTIEAGIEIAGAAPPPETPAGVNVAVTEVAPEPRPAVPLTRALDPLPNPETLVLAAASVMTAPKPEPILRPEPEVAEVVTRLSTSGGRHSGISLGRFTTRDAAERILITMSLSDMGGLGGALRRVVQRGGGFEANFMGMSSEEAQLACRRIMARGRECSIIGG